MELNNKNAEQIIETPKAINLCKFAFEFELSKTINMRPFITRFTLLLGLLLIMTGVAMNYLEEAKTTLATVLISIGLIVYFISLYFQRKKKKAEDTEVYPEPDPEDFKANDEDTYTIEEQSKK